MAPTGFPFSFNGKDYFLRRVTQDDKLSLLATGNAQLLADVAAATQYQTTEQANACFDEAMKRVIARTMWLDDSDGRVYANSRAGFTRLCWICTRGATPDVPKPALAVIEKLFDSDNGVTLVRYYKAANASPTEPQPSAGKIGDGSTGDSPPSAGFPGETSAA